MSQTQLKMLFNTADSSTLIGSIVQSSQAKQDTAAYQRVIDLTSQSTDSANALLYAKFDTAKDMSDKVKSNLIDIQSQIKSGSVTAEEGLGKINELMVKSQTQASGLSNTFKNIGLSIVNGLASAAISTAIALVITYVSKLADKLIMTRKEAKSLSDQFSDTFSSAASEQAKTAKTIADIEDEYEELSQGVSILGENISLTDEQFERYHEITQIIAENIPELIQGYDDQGAAIIRLRDDVKSLTDAYKENQQAAALDLYNQTNEDGNVIKGVYKNAQNDIQDEFYEETSSSDAGRTFTHTANIQQQLEMRKQLAAATHDELVDLYETNAYARSILQEMMSKGYDITSDNETDIAKVHAQLQKDSTELETTLESDAKRVAEAGLTYAQAYQGYYTELTAEQQKYVSAVMNNMDFDFVYQNGLFDQDSMEKYVQDLMNTFKGMSDEDLTKLQVGVDLSTSWNNNELSYNEYIERLKEFYNILETLFPGNEQIQKSIKVLFDMPESIEDVQDKLETAANRRSRVISNKTLAPVQTQTTQETPKQELLNGTPSISGVLQDKTAKDNEVVVPLKYTTDEESLAKSNEVYLEWLSKLKGEKAKLAEEASDDQLLLTTNFKKPEDFDRWLDEMQAELDENPLEIKATASDLVSDLKDIEDAFGGLDTVKSAGTSASASDIEQVNSDMGGVTFGKYGEALDDVNAMSSAIEKYNQVLTDNESTTEDVNKATDDLVTAYIDLSGKLDNVTEETKDKTIEELESYGVENAEAVVTSRLNDVYKKFAKNIKTLATRVAQYHDTLDESVDPENFEDASESFKSAANDIADVVKEMFTTTGADGEDLVPNIDGAFVAQNLGLIQAAAEGDTEAIAALRVEAAKTIDVDINVNDDELYSEWSNVSAMISALDGSQFEIGGTMDDSAIIATLNNILATGKYTVEEFQKMVSQISGGTLAAEMTWEQKTVDLPTPTFSFANWKSNGGGAITADTKINWQTSKVNYNLPKFTYKYNGGTGTGAKYSGGNNNSNNSGGNNDNSGSTTKNTKTEDDIEVYDWIEKYIDNLEDALDKLDDKVNDTYDNWVNRNKNVGEEIKNLNEQIKANNTAKSHYEKYANSIKVNNGKDKVDDDDYGDNDTEQKTYDQAQLDAAIKVWNDPKKKYQNLIQKGKLGKEDIEKIQNKYLRDALSEYEEWWNKAKEAGDKATSLAYDLKSKYQDLFNNVKDNYDELINDVEKRTDLVQKNIDRMQEEGHFVNKKYYNQQLSLNAEVEANQRKELEELRKKYNDAITTGGIDKNSEAARSMLSDIYDKAADLGETLNEAIRIKKDIRQLGWDKFDWLEERMARINDEAEHYQNILSHYKQVDDLGNFTSEGWGNLAMDYSKYESNQKALERYKAEYESLRKELDKDPTDQEVINRLDDTQNKIWELEESSLEAVENMKSKLNEAFDANLNHLNETIDKYKEALQDAKDLFSYQKNIESQTNNIMKLEKQLAAYRGDTSEAGRKKQVELQQKYKEAQEQLKETEWDKYISETGELLDDLYEDYQKLLTGYLDNFQNILGDVKTALDSNPGKVADAFATKISEWDKNNGNLGKSIESISTTIGGLSTSISTALSAALKEAQKSAAEGSTVANEAGTVVISIDEKTGKITITTKKGETTNTGGGTGSNGTNQGSITEVAPDPNQKLSTISSPEEEKAAIEASKREEQEEIARQNKLRQQQEAAEAAAKAAAEKKERAKKWINGTFYDANGDVKYKGGAWRQDDTGWWYRYTDKDGNEAWLASATHTIDGVKYTFNADGYWNGGSVEAVPVGISSKNATTTKKTKKKTTKKKAKGDKHIAYSGIYETNEADTGTELIYKTQSGGILTPLDAGDMVFTNEMSKRLWDIAANNIPTGGTVQMVNLPTNINGGTVNTNADISITLPNVTNYAEFKKELQNDDNFEKFIKEITVGQLNGNNTLKKRKY